MAAIVDWNNLYTIEEDPEGLAWKIAVFKGQTTTPYCRKHAVPVMTTTNDVLECPRGKEHFILKYPLDRYREYVERVVKDGKLEDLKVIRLDEKGSAVLAREKNKTNPEYFIESKLSDTRKGLELMVQVGKRDGSKKVQLFVDLPAERMGFDTSTKDQHPAGIFSEITAVFKNSKTTIKKRSK